MRNPTLTIAAHLADGAQGRASAFVPSNQRVTSKGMPLSVQTDVPTFPGTSPAQTVTGTWVVAGTRAWAMGIGIVNGASSGVGYNAVPASTGPMQINPGNRDVTVKF